MATFFRVIILDPLAHQLYVNNTFDKLPANNGTGKHAVHIQYSSKMSLHESDIGFQ
jgi:hypothetical protein